MPERQKYEHLFRGNPFARTTPDEMFSVLNWGNKHRRISEIDAPEPLVMLGMTKLLILPDRHLIFSGGDAFLAVGQKSNELYIIPRVNDRPKSFIPEFSRRTTKYIGPVLQTDYMSSKGGIRPQHYYHTHQEPYPKLWVHSSGVGYIRASNNNGKPSYAVGKEGIVG